MKQCPGQYDWPVETTISLIGGKYKAVILWHLIDKTLRFNELQKLVQDNPYQRWFVPSDLSCCICEECYRDFKEMFRWKNLMAGILIGIIKL